MIANETDCFSIVSDEWMVPGSTELCEEPTSGRAVRVRLRNDVPGGAGHAGRGFQSAADALRSGAQNVRLLFVLFTFL